jgi:uncharacterized membrane protein YphA (DoxX/SURF4 family)
MNRDFTKKLFSKVRLIWTLRIFLSVLFLTACIPKIINSHEFALAIFKYRIFPYYLINFTAISLPWLEFTVAIALLFWRKGRKAALIIIIVMLFLFTIAIASSLLRGIDIACGCFSVKIDAAHIGWISIARNVLLIFTASWLLYSEKP